MLVGALFIIGVDLLAEIYESLSGISIWYQEYLIIVAMLLLVSFLGYYGINQSKILLPDFLLEEDKLNTKKEVKNKVQLHIAKTEFEPLKNELELLFSNSRPYLDENLTLGKLANELSITDKKLSILLNQFMNTNFYDLVNKYRVLAVTQKMEQDTYKNYNLFGIACECGFKSRTSFNRIFKNETGYSPSAYKKNLS